MGTLQLPAYVVALGSVVSVIVSATKGGIEQVLPASNKWHDVAFTLYPLVLTLALVMGYTASHGGDMFWSVVWGLLSGAFSIGAYTIHTRTGTMTSAADAPPVAQSAPGAPVSVDLSRPLRDPRQPAWAAALTQEAPPATAGTAQPAVAATPPEPPQAPPEAPVGPVGPVGPSVTYSSGPPTP